MLDKLRKQNREKGSVSIEATIALTSFLFMFIMIYSVITICRAQARIQIAIDATAKEISQYSYIYGLTGLDQSLKKFQDSAGEAEDGVNEFIGNMAGMFEGMQTLGDAGATLATGDVGTVISEWETISGNLKEAEGDYNAVKSSIEKMAENPQELLLGMAKIVGSNALETMKSRAIAEPVARALVKKHLKRSNDDTAEAFCRSVGITPGTYFGTTNYFNGLDFSNSTLFAYGSDEISIVVSYKVKLLQLLPVDLEFFITQKAVTRGWLHGDMSSSGNSAESKIAAINEVDGKSVWNSATVKERSDLIRSMGVKQLKDEGYYGVSGSGAQYIHAYDPVTNTFVNISSTNQLYGLSSMSELSNEDIKEKLKSLESSINSATDNRSKIKIKKSDSNGNIVTEEKDCSATKIKKVIVVIPEDAGLKEKYEAVVKELGSDVIFEIQPGYGCAFKTETPKEDEGGGE